MLVRLVLGVRRLWIVLLCGACGPVVSGGSDDGSTSAMEGPDGSTGEAPDPTLGTSGDPSGPDPSGPDPSGPGTSTGTTEGGESGSSTGDGITFIEPTGGCGDLPDGVLGHCSLPECTPEEQECFEGEACKAWANDGGAVWNATRCSPVPDDAGLVGEPCAAEGSAVTGVDTCDVGLMCWNVDPETLEGTCAEYCDAEDGDPGCTDPSETCSVWNESVLPLCLPACDPLASTCGEGFGCYPGSEANFVCVRDGEQVHQDDVFHPECSSGTFWANAERVDGCVDDEPCCAAYCDLSAAAPCGAGVECLPFFKAPDPAFEDVGYCQAAQ